MVEEETNQLLRENRPYFEGDKKKHPPWVFRENEFLKLFGSISRVEHVYYIYLRYPVTSAHANISVTV